MSQSFNVAILNSVVDSANTTTEFVLQHFDIFKDADIEFATKIITEIIKVLKELYRLTDNGTIIKPKFNKLDANITKALTMLANRPEKVYEALKELTAFKLVDKMIKDDEKRGFQSINANKLQKKFDTYNTIQHQ